MIPGAFESMETYWQVRFDNKRGDAVVYETCLYVGAAAFIIEFQGSPLV